MPHLSIGFYRQNEWANLLLIEACRSLSEEQLDATAVGTFGSIRDTLTHIVSAEGSYAFRLGHEPKLRLTVVVSDAAVPLASTTEMCAVPASLGGSTSSP